MVVLIPSRALAITALTAAAVAAAPLRARLSAQTSLTITLRDSAIAKGIKNSCWFRMGPIPIAASGTADDTVHLQFVANSSDTTPSTTPLRLTVRAGAGTGEVEQVRAGEHSIPLPFPSRTLPVGRVVVSTPSQPELCVVAFDDPSPARQEDSATTAFRDSLALVGNSYIILSLIKSISGEIPQREFFDLRMKFGGEITVDTAAIGARARRRAVAAGYGRRLDYLRRLRGDTAKWFERVGDRQKRRLEAEVERASVSGGTPAQQKSNPTDPEASAKRRRDSAKVEFEIRRDSVLATLDDSIARLERARDRAVDSVALKPARRPITIDRAFLLSNFDIAFTPSDDSTPPANRRFPLSDAGLTVNYTFLVPGRGRLPQRMAFASFGAKVFNFKSYYGPNIGLLEMRGSRLEGTYVTVGYARPLYRDSALVVDSNRVLPAALLGSATSRVAPPPLERYERLTNHNLYGEFFVRVPHAQFLDRLRIRGGLIYPIGPRNRFSGPEARLTLSVPVVDLDRF